MWDHCYRAKTKKKISPCLSHNIYLSSRMAKNRTVCHIDSILLLVFNFMMNLNAIKSVDSKRVHPSGKFSTCDIRAHKECLERGEPSKITCKVIGNLCQSQTSVSPILYSQSDFNNKQISQLINCARLSIGVRRRHLTSSPW